MFEHKGFKQSMVVVGLFIIVIFMLIYTFFKMSKDKYDDAISEYKTTVNGEVYMESCIDGVLYIILDRYGISAKFDRTGHIVRCDEL